MARGVHRLTAAVLILGLAGAAGTGWSEEQGAGAGMAVNHQLSKATFAGGCFWCMEPPFRRLPGVISVMPGYTGGTKANPTYEEVSSGSTGHAEAVEILYDPSQVSYEQLLDAFWMNIDPTQADGQFAVRGSQYRTAIFTHTEDQERRARESKERLARSGKFTAPLVTEIVRASAFYPAEDYHREYYKKHPLRYQMYKAGSGREGFIKRTWGQAAEAAHE